MSLLTKNLVLNNTNDILKLKESKDQRIKIILLNESILIKVLKVNNYYNIEEKIEELIKDMFSDYIPLVHYEKLRVRRKLFLIIYFIGCDERFKKLLCERKKFSLIPYDLQKKNFYIFNKVEIVLRNSRIKVYFKKRLILLRNIEEQSVIEDIKDEIKNLEETFNISIKSFNLIISKEYITDELKESFKDAKLSEIRGEDNLYQKI
ncbi:hypothetical protein [Clostridium sp. LIBA-8841]|uniref:hypothetical protein n=1 Tax=Clostridium sp. LIBA-8841 TaxID=2987530 RepID=UPI002AC73836|nr:hypothetical protein [Clostridium sp. LIBA-8841]MDZ5252782.1 hypothetical protein [Clostridium sp. LIBA-8841]